MYIHIYIYIYIQLYIISSFFYTIQTSQSLPILPGAGLKSYIMELCWEKGMVRKEKDG